MGSGICGCCDLQSSKAPEISITSPKNKLSLLGFSSLTSPKVLNTEAELQNRIKLLENVRSDKVLKLKVINTGNLPKGIVFIINPRGLENSDREVLDGYTYFGCKKKSLEKVINDIIIPVNDSELTATQKSQNFMILYHIEKDTFIIRDLGKGFGPFIKVNHSYVIKDNWMINIGETFLVFGIESMHLGLPRLTIKKFSGNESGNTKTFEASEHVETHILIGRDRKCDIEIEDYLLSKVQCSLFFDANSGWNIIDGDIRTQKESTNGTWLYVSEEMEIVNGMIIKSYQTLLQATLIK
ncbi:hypothetical protein SteCoe_35756 [Stentor coeruleus]|uniref:FHA domain-containing protein n=1 Tax=Stentor coeruleus TaxID=5963 RepID=A0A1R2ARK4_9CILI|nr:hypothetical protein SteCoe_35756 [Stentor coeruleus]